MLSQDKVGLTQRMHNFVREHPDFEVVHGPTRDFYCFRYLPNGLAERLEEPDVQTQLDRLNQRIVEAIQPSGLALVMTTRVRDRVAIQMSICSQRTVAADIDATFEAIARWGRLLSRSSDVDNAVEKEALSCSNESCSLLTEVSAT